MFYVSNPNMIMHHESNGSVKREPYINNGQSTTDINIVEFYYMSSLCSNLLAHLWTTWHLAHYKTIYRNFCRLHFKWKVIKNSEMKVVVKHFKLSRQTTFTQILVTDLFLSSGGTEFIQQGCSNTYSHKVQTWCVTMILY